MELDVAPSRYASVRQHLKRVGERNASALLALRRAELLHVGAAQGQQAALERVAELEAAFERVRRAGKIALQRQDLAIDGERVIRILGCKPGPVVGRALRHLTDCVVEDPSCNTPEALRALLEAWAEAGKN